VTALKAAIESADLWLLHEIDPQALLRRGGIAIGPARQLLFFHPRYMKRLLDAEPAAILEAPLKFALLTDAAGVVVRWYDPVRTFRRYGNVALDALAAELSALCSRIIDSGLRPTP
jgi:uncharacterized protein (DUF302 family)